MVTRSFFAYDNDILVDQSTGNGIINNSSTPVGTQFVFNSTGYDNEYITIEDTAGDLYTLEDDQEGGHIIVDGKGLVAEGMGVDSKNCLK